MANIANLIFDNEYTNIGDEYQGNAAEKLAQLAGYRLSRNGDTALSPDFEEALLRAEAREKPEADPAQRREDAEVIAQFLLDLPETPLTIESRSNVRLLLALSKLTDAELEADSLNRESITIALIAANQNHMDARKKETRQPVISTLDLK